MADNNQEHNNSANAVAHAGEAAPQAAVADSAHAGKPEAAQNNIFSEILSKNIGDHYGYSFYNAFHLDFPMIFVDNGFHFYASKKAMEEAGTFTTVHHKVVRVSDHQPPMLDLSITSLVMFQWLTMLILLFSFMKVAKRYKKEPTKAPRGFQNLLEVMICYVRDEIVAPNIPGDKTVRRLLPYFIALFFFILVMNLFGLVPGGHSATGNLAVTAALAIIAFFVINATAIRESGIGAWLHHLLGGAPWWLAPIMVPIEILSMFTKPFALTIRLFANMTAGHVIILCLIGLIFFFKSLVIAPITVGFSLFIYALETLVAFIQAYVFTMLTAVFVGLAIGEHSLETEESH